MGLDTVELLLRIEEVFGLSVSDAEAGKIITVGDMHALIVEKLRLRGEAADEGQIWERLKEIIIDQLGVKPEEVTPSAEFVRDLKAD